MRRFTVAEIIDRLRQAALARAESTPLLRRWLLSDAATRGCGNASPAFSGLALLDRSDGVAQRKLAADRILRGQFDLLGYRSLSFGTPIDWHLEPISGRRSPQIPWVKLNNSDASLTGDKKVVWELNRQQYLLTLGQAFRQSGDERYAAEVVRHIGTWIEGNPPGLGINWVSSLELAFRCISWLWALALIRRSHAWRGLDLRSVANSLHDQALHIERYLSTYTSPNTHLTGEALGLYYIGCCVPELQHAARWRKLGRHILLQQLPLQVRPDGVYFEQASWYQRYTADFYVHFVLLAQRTGDPLPGFVRTMLEGLFDHLLWLMRPDGTFPNIGDDDGGKLLKLDEREAGDWRAALSNAAVLFERGDFKFGAQNLADETRWLFGDGAAATFAAIEARPPAQLAKAFPDGGYFVMRSAWSERANYCLLDCGPQGFMNCGHGHADALAIELSGLGSAFLVDPGTCSYSAETPDRNRFRGSCMHSTLTLDGLPASVPAGPFMWQHIAKATLGAWIDHRAFVYFSGSHDGYRRLDDPVTHRREIFFPLREYWVVLDRCDASAAHEVAVHFHGASGVTIEPSGDARRITLVGAKGLLDIAMPTGEGRWQISDSYTSPCYGEKLAAGHASYVTQTTGPVVMACVLVPRDVASPAPAITAPGGNAGAAQREIRVSYGPHEDVLQWRAQSSDAHWLWVRRQSQSGAVRQIILLQGRHFAVDEFTFSAERALASAVASFADRSLTLELSDAVGLSLSLPLGIDQLVINGRSIAVGTERQLSLGASVIGGSI